MGLLVNEAMGDPGRFRLGRAFRGLKRGISIRNLRAGIRGLAPFASFVPGAGFLGPLSAMAGDKPGAKGGTRAHPSKHGTSQPHAKPSHAHARTKAAHKGPGMGSKVLASMGTGLKQAMGAFPEALGAVTGGHPQDLLTIGAPHLGMLGGHRRRMNFMNIKAARRAGRRVAGAIRLLHSLEKSLPHVRGHKVFKPHKRRR